MIAADTSAWLDFSTRRESGASARLESSLSAGTLDLPTPVLFELLSGPGLTKEGEALIRQLPTLATSPGFWERAAETRRILLHEGRKAKALDCLIAQNCIDHEVALIASDTDFRLFTRFGLKLV